MKKIIFIFVILFHINLVSQITYDKPFKKNNLNVNIVKLMHSVRENDQKVRIIKKN